MAEKKVTELPDFLIGRPTLALIYFFLRANPGRAFSIDEIAQHIGRSRDVVERLIPILESVAFPRIVVEVDRTCGYPRRVYKFQRLIKR